MPAVACLIADPSRQPLDGKLVDEAARAVDGKVRWLAEAEAAEVATDLEPDAAATRLAALVAGQPLDLNLLPAEHRRKRLLLCDMDSTVITIECIDELAGLAGIKPQIAAVTRRAMNGELDFAAALRERVGLLKGLDEAVIARVIRDRITLMPGGRALVATMRAHGAYAALVSGGFTAFTGAIAGVMGFDENRANTLLMSEGKLSGHVANPILGRAAKVQALEEISARLGVTPEAAIAVGDGANDLGMLGLAGMGVALHAKPSVQEECQVRVNHGDLTALLFLQGYTRDQFSE